MHAANRFAFKEWAVICAALGAGRQSLILRKGGIHEGRDGFRVEHSEFWLFPTNFHQADDDLTEDYRDLWETVRRNPPLAETISLRLYAVVEQAVELADEAALPRLTGLHGWSERAIRERFHYKRPGLFALLVRVFELPDELPLPNAPHFAGCRSWVELPDPLPTSNLRPVLSDAEHAARRDLLRERLLQGTGA
jgi:hypothetical protein